MKAKTVKLKEAFNCWGNDGYSTILILEGEYKGWAIGCEYNTNGFKPHPKEYQVVNINAPKIPNKNCPTLLQYPHKRVILNQDLKVRLKDWGKGQD